LHTSSSQVIKQQVLRRQQRGRQQRHMQNVLQGTGQHRQGGMQQQKRGSQVGFLAGFMHKQQRGWPSLGKEEHQEEGRLQSLYMRTHAHTRTPTRTHACTYTRMHTHVRAHTHTRKHKHTTHTHIRRQLYTHTYTYTTRAHTYAHAHTSTCVHARTPAQVRTCTRAYICVHGLRGPRALA